MNPRPSESVEPVDLVVIGSGVGGMTTALVAAIGGLKVLVLEKTALVGGSTSYSSGGAFLPGCHHLPPEADPTAPTTYIAHCVGERLDRGMLAAYLDNGPAALALLEAHTEVRFQAYGGVDYRMDVPGASTTPRTVLPVSFDGRVLGAWLRRLRPPLPRTMIFGGMQVDYLDIDRLRRAMRSPSAFAHAARLIARHAFGLLRYGRSPRLVFGNALAGRLLKSVLDRPNIELRTEAQAVGLRVEGGRVVGVDFLHGGMRRSVRATRGVMLASGGFPGDTSVRAERLAFAGQHLSLPPPANVGDGIRLALQSGAVWGADPVSDRCLTPVSAYTTPRGEKVLFPHFAFDRCKPGCIAVGLDGKRFVNEGLAYSDFAAAMTASSAVPAFLVCDHPFLRKYGLGMVLPAPFSYRPYLRRKYLVRAATIGELAAKLGVDAPALEATVARNNRFAADGRDLDFGKGDDLYSRSLGDSAHGPNPCLGAISQGPFYAIKLHTGDTATTAGLAVDAHARVTGECAVPIPGLYACGPDMANPTMGCNVSGGFNIGPALTFGYLAATHMLGGSAETAPSVVKRAPLPESVHS